MAARFRSWRPSGCLAAIGVLCAAGQFGAAPADHVEQPAKEVTRIEIPLKDGRIDLEATLREMFDAIGADPSNADWVSQLPSLSETVKKMQLDRIGELTDGAITVQIGDDAVTLTIDEARIKSAAERTKQSVAGWLEMQLRGPDGVGPPYGISFVLLDGELVSLAEIQPPPKHLVVVVHGLDDPGWIFRDVISAVQRAGFDVARFDYPNDGPISESADQLATELERLRSAGVQRIDLIAHSMGGLVCRDVLTRTAHYNGDGRGGERFPAVGDFIMLGTPNHGSHMARLRQISELGEHFSRLFRGETHSFRLLGDGGGEAGVDLLPDSDFLRRLNARSLVEHVEIAIIAGRISPLEESDVESWIDKVQSLMESEQAPQWVRDLAERDEAALVRKNLAGAVRGLGDGVVSLDSARLEGVDDFVIVEADHMSMMVNLIKSSRIPPAIPLILERLERPGAGGDDRSRE